MNHNKQVKVSAAALEVNDISFSYAGKKALDEVNFIVKPAECNILLGPNGAGKSTLFALITRLYDTHHGKISISGHNIKQQTGAALSQLGVVFQQTTLDMDLTVLQNLRYHASLHGMRRKYANQRIQQELERLQMYDRRQEKVRQLNGGHKRRVEIARALLHKPSVLLLDEPTIGLDVPSRKSIVEHVHRLVSEQGLSVLWATHLIDEIYQDDQMIVLFKGKIKYNGSVPGLLQSTASESIHQAFDSLTRESV